MKSLYLLIVPFVLTEASAQPVLLYGNVGLPGSIYDLYTVVDPGDSDPTIDGADVTWDFTTAQIDLAAGCIFTLPGGTPYAADYPAANLARIYLSDNGTFYNYYITAPDGWTILVRGAGSGGQLLYDDPSTLIPFPFSYGYQFTDDYTENGIPFSQVVSYSGYGTMELITGTVEDVVKVSRSNGEITFYRSDPVEPLMTVNPGGGVTIWERNAIGLEERGLPALRLFPNPTIGLVRTMGLTAGSVRTVLDATGRVVIPDHPCGLTADLDLTPLPPGLYRVIVRDDRGSRSATVIRE